MAWTTPRTWVVGEPVSAALLNAQIRDNLLETLAAKVTTAQDLFQGTAANTIARVTIGSVGNVYQVLTASTIGWGAAPTGAFPAGSIIFHNGGACPNGWAEVTTARGRILVGLPAGGTLAGTVGSALTDLGTRTITTNAAHTHGAGTLALATSSTHTHTHTVSGGAASVVADNTSSVGATQSTSSDGAHTHTVSGSTGSTGSASVDVTMPFIQYIVCEKS